MTLTERRPVKPRGSRAPLGFHEPNPELLIGYCQGFKVLKTQTVGNVYFKLSMHPDGSKTYKLNGLAVVEMRNQTSGTVLAYNNNGPGTWTEHADGKVSVNLSGPKLFWFKPEQLVLVQGVPTISYTTGHLRFSMDTSGRVTSYELSGKQTDVCAALA